MAGKACKKSSKKYPPVGGMYWRAARATSVRARWRASRAASTAIQRAPAVAERGGEEEVVAGYVILFRIRNCSALGPQTIDRFFRSIPHLKKAHTRFFRGDEGVPHSPHTRAHAHGQRFDIKPLLLPPPHPPPSLPPSFRVVPDVLRGDEGAAAGRLLEVLQGEGRGPFYLRAGGPSLKRALLWEGRGPFLWEGRGPFFGRLTRG